MSCQLLCYRPRTLPWRWCRPRRWRHTSFQHSDGRWWERREGQHLPPPRQLQQRGRLLPPPPKPRLWPRLRWQGQQHRSDDKACGKVAPQTQPVRAAEIVVPLLSRRCCHCSPLVERCCQFVPTCSKSQIFVFSSIHDSTYTENLEYLWLATGFWTLWGNLLQLNRF